MQLRPDVDEYFLTQALLLSSRGTCIRRRCGCVLVDHNNHVLSSGYNGSPRGSVHCISFPCAGSESSPGQGLERCEAVHAEANAIIQCKDTQSIKTAYCTHSPCVLCVGLLMNTSCERIVFLD
jgi:dCMP deaminase